MGSHAHRIQLRLRPFPTSRFEGARDAHERRIKRNSLGALRERRPGGGARKVDGGEGGCKATRSSSRSAAPIATAHVEQRGGRERQWRVGGDRSFLEGEHPKEELLLVDRARVRVATAHEAHSQARTHQRSRHTTRHDR